MSLYGLTSLLTVLMIKVAIVATEEYYCGYEMSRQNEWKCNTTSTCISNYERCDGTVDCSDGSDELDCYTCEWAFLCHNRKCIHLEHFCDGKNDCGDNSDETSGSCVPKTASHYSRTCKDLEWRCNDSRCILDSNRCNGEVNCDDGSDENNCVACKDNSFSCKNHRCITHNYVCDQVDNCGDNSDEPKSCWYNALNTNSIFSAIGKTYGGIFGGVVGFIFLIIVVIITLVVCFRNKNCPLHNRRQRQEPPVVVIDRMEPIMENDQESDSLIKNEVMNNDAIEKSVAENRGNINWHSNVHLEY